MCSISVEPMPSRISTPNLLLNCSKISEGSVSPADTAMRKEEQSTSSPRAASRSSAAENVGTENKTVGRYFFSSSAVRSGLGLPGSRTVLAPAEKGKYIPLPSPYAKNNFETEYVTSSGRNCNTPCAYPRLV